MDSNNKNKHLNASPMLVTNLAHINTWAFTRTHTHPHTDTHTPIYTHLHIDMHIYICIYMVLLKNNLCITYIARKFGKFGESFMICLKTSQISTYK